MYDHHLNIKKDKKKLPRTLHPNIKIKKEEDHVIEMAFSFRALQEYQTNGHGSSQCIPETVAQEEQRGIKDETEMLANIEESKETINFYIKEEETDSTDVTIFDIAMVLSHINDKTNYNKVIHEKLP